MENLKIFSCLVDEVWGADAHQGPVQDSDGNDDLPEAEFSLPEIPNADQQAAYDIKM